MCILITFPLIRCLYHPSSFWNKMNNTNKYIYVVDISKRWNDHYYDKHKNYKCIPLKYFSPIYYMGLLGQRKKISGAWDNHFKKTVSPSILLTMISYFNNLFTVNIDSHCKGIFWRNIYDERCKQNGLQISSTLSSHQLLGEYIDDAR